MIVLYQNGEPLMPGNGYPMRLLLPGYEGNMNIKYVRRIKLLPEPAMSYWEVAGLYRAVAERKGLSILLRQRGEIVHHLAVSRTRSA